MTEEISSTTQSSLSYEPDNEKPTVTTTEDISATTQSTPLHESDGEKPTVTATEEIPSTTQSIPTFESDDDERTVTTTEEIPSTTPSAPTYEPDEVKPTVTAMEKFVTETAIITPSPTTHPIFAPLHMPLYRRRQTLTILVWFLTPWICLYLSFVLLRCNNWYILSAFLLYLTWMVLFQKYSRTGGFKQQWLRRLQWWKWFADYFPIRLHKTCDLPPDRSYIFGYHPHGIISLGAFCNFATEATGFEEKYPGINLRLLTLQVNFRIPFYGIYLAMLGLCDASKESCNYVLEKGNGNSILLVLGGAKESLDAHPSHEYILTLKNRKGFVKIGLANGASLVPVFSFGENDLYDQVANPRGSRLRHIQMMLQKRLGYATPFFKGRGIFQYAIGFLPVRHDVDTYVGEPILLPKLDRDKITSEIIDKYHTEYMEALKRLFDTYKARHGNADATIKFVNDNE